MDPLLPLVAISMLITNSLLIREVRRGAEGRRLAAIIYVTGTMLLSFVVTAFFITTRNPYWILYLILTTPTMFFLIVFLLVMGGVRRNWITVFLFTAFLVASEVAMGGVFYAVEFGLDSPWDSVQSYWYTGVVSSELGFVIAYVGERRLSAIMIPIMIALSPASYPWSYDFIKWSTLASLAMAAIALLELRSRSLGLDHIIPILLVIGEVYLYVTGIWYPLDALLVLVPILMIQRLVYSGAGFTSIRH